MLVSIISLLLLLIPGYSLLHINWIKQKIDLNNLDKIIFGFIIWLYYIASTILIVKIMFPNYVKVVFGFNYFLGFILAVYWLFKEMLEVLFNLRARANYKIKCNLMDITLCEAFLFLLPMIAFVVVITLYTPLIYQYDALGLYLIEGRQLIDGLSFLAGTWPTFGDSMPVIPIIYSWFFYLSDAPILRLIPLTFFFLMILLVYNMGRKLFPRNPHAAYISVVSLVSMTSLQWYMAKTSLYLDLGFIFLSASSIYTLILALDNEATRINVLILGMNLAILSLSKEFGIFQTWFIIVILIFSRFKGILKNPIQGLVLSISLLLPFLIYYLSFKTIFSFYDVDIVGTNMIFRFFILITFLLLLNFAFNEGEFQVPRLSLSKLFVVLVPLFVPILFIIRNLFVLGVPFGNLKEPYVQSLLKSSIVYSSWKPPDVSLLNILDIFLTQSIMTINLIPFLVFILAILLPRFRKKMNRHSSLLALWFFYSLFIFYFVSYDTMEGGIVRRILPLAIPLSLMVGKGVHYLVTYQGWPDWVSIVTYTSANSVSLAYLWFVKFDNTKWWFLNLNSLIMNNSWVSYLEFLIYTIPWFLLILLMIVSKSRLGQLKIFSKKFLSVMGIILLLVSAVTPITIFIQSIRYPKSWNPSYYDEVDSVKPYVNHWFIPILDFYRSRLSDDNYTTIGFGVTPLQYFLKRPFIDLNHPRNWLIYLPLFQELSTDKLLSYLDKLDIRYFLIPTEEYGHRDKYEFAIKNSTLFKLINTSTIVKNIDGQMFRFEKLASSIPFELYVLKFFPS